MAKCPECGGEMVSQLKRKICQTCGLALTEGEYDRAWDKIHDKKYDEQDKKKKHHDEYLKWYTSKKE